MDDQPIEFDDPALRGEPQHRSDRGESRPGRPLRLRPLLAWFLAALAAAGAIYFLTRSSRQPQRARFAANAPVPVDVAAVTRGEMPVTISGLGTVTPLKTVTVETRVSGELMSVGFRQGQMVKKGQFLAQIDPRPYQVALEQAEGQLARDKALLANARHDLARYNRLVAQDSIARQTRDTQAALVKQDEATVLSDKAQIDAQKLNLTYAHIVAPITGMAGLRLVDPGNYLPANASTGIVVLTQMDPMSVIFTIPENSIAAVLKRLAAGATLEAKAYDQSGKTLLAVGRLFALDNQINTTTGTLSLRAIFPNPKEMLFPNQFVNVTLVVDTLHHALLVPNAAIQRGSPGTFVYVVAPNGGVKVAPVTLGPGAAQERVVLSGLEAGERVVVDGADQLRAGARVRVLTPAARTPSRSDSVSAGSERPGSPGHAGEGR